MNALLIVLSTLFCLSLAAVAETVSLTPSADTTLFELLPDNNLGGLNNVAAGKTARATLSRALIKFDVAGRVPTNVIITGASLRLNIVRIPLVPQSSTFFLHRVLRDWGEGNKSASTLGEPAVAGEATWNNRFHPSTPWQAPGGAADVDFSSTASSSSDNSDAGLSVFESSQAMTADVQHWLANPAENFGWMVVSGSEDVSSTARRFGSREDAVNTPVLDIEYGSPFRIGNPALAGTTIRFSFPVEPLFTYTVEARQSLANDSWTVFTNFTETLSSYNAMISDGTGAPSRFYRVLKAPCNCQ